jgi:hypothetical protein
MSQNTTDEIPPTFPTFSMTLGVLVNKNNETQKSTTVTASNTSVNPINPIVIQMPFQYPYSNTTSTHPVSSLSPSTNLELPSISEFLLSLDQKFNCNNVYSKFENAFLDEEITVNGIKDLSDEQMVKLGIVKIGWQKNIKQAAQKY